MHMKDLPGLIRDGANKIMAGYQQIKRDANPNVLGTAADRMKQAMENALPNTRSGAPAPNKGRPTR